MSRVTRRSSAAWSSPLSVLAALLAAATVVGLVVLAPTGEDRPDLRALGITGDPYDAEVEVTEEMACQGTAEQEGVRCRRVTFRLLEGPDQGVPTSIDFSVQGGGVVLAPGEKVVLARQRNAQPGFEYAFVDRQRKPALVWLTVLFAVVVVALARLRGVAALGGLAISLGVLLAFVLPSILDGRPPVLVAVVGASAVAYLALYLAHGFSLKTTVALLGTLAGLGLTEALASGFTALTRISGFATEEAILVRATDVPIDLAGLILAGVVIGGLGAIDDATVTQASAVWELRAADRAMTPPALFRAGLRIGRDHVASMVNTLVLAYAGASMPLLVLFVLSRQSLATVANSEVVATEIVRTLVGSIGLIASVPITTWLGARAAPARGPRGRQRELG